MLKLGVLRRIGLQALSSRGIWYDPNSSSILKLTIRDAPDTEIWRVISKENYSSTHVLDRNNGVIVHGFPLLDWFAVVRSGHYL